MEAGPSARFREFIRSQIVVERGGSGTRQYLAVSCRLEENIYCNQPSDSFKSKASKARGPPGNAQRLRLMENICLEPAVGGRFLT